MNNHCKFSETVAQNQISSPNPHASPKKSYSIVWEACLRHPRSAIPSIASIALYSLYSPPPGVATHDAVQQATGAVFFRRSRLFLREAAFFSGGEGCEWGAQRATVGESGDKAENLFSGFIPLAGSR